MWRQTASQRRPCGLEALGVPDAGRQAVVYAERKQKRLERTYRRRTVAAFPTRSASLRRPGAGLAHGGGLLFAQRANQMMKAIPLDVGQSLLDAFSVNVCGRDLPEGKPNPAIFLLAARELRIEPRNASWPRTRLRALMRARRQAA